uniref:CD2-associated protein isoform X1 n=2 Tax=Doryrhamphus excisus TaxID=161450 RepID=UPI0025AE0FCE|nr:CD2-associated protein isoform X1 [Doryrhamphus excisus]
MQRIYMHSNEHFDVFTTVLAPQGRNRYRAEAEKMVVVHSYSPHWPDELELTAGDVIVVLSQHEEGRWFGRLQDGQQGYFPASCVVELGQDKSVRRSTSLRTSSTDQDGGVRRNSASGHILQALRRGSRGGGGAGEAGLDGGQDGSEAPVPPSRRPSYTQPLQHASPQMQRSSPGLLHRILSRCRRKSECQGATNGAFEED